MNKCKNCGTEFEGNFCPECGVKHTALDKCSVCGAQIKDGVKFCPQCGFSTDGYNPRDKQTHTGGLTIAYKLCGALPTILFCLFSLLMFVFMATPVATASLLGMSESLGNIYDVQKLSANISGTAGIAVSTIVISSIGAFVALFSAAYELHKKRGIYKFSILFTLFYIAFIIIAVVTKVKISSFDGGIGLIKTGAEFTLILVFSIVFTVIGLVATIARKVLGSNPEVLETLKYAKEAKQKRIESFKATHKKPELKTNTRKGRAIYTYSLKRWENGKAGYSPAAVWFNVYKKPLIFFSIIIAITVIVLCITIPIQSNIFRIGKIKHIDLGDTKASVKKHLGEPTVEKDTYMEYYDDDVVAIVKKIEEANNNLDLQTSLKLQEQLSKMTYGYIRLDFGGEKNRVCSILLDKSHDNSIQNSLMERKQTSFYCTNDIKINVIKFNIDDEVTIRTCGMSISDNSYYSAEYSDGSRIESYLSERNISCVVSDKKAEWSDQLGNYSKEIRIHEVATVKYNDDGSENEISYDSSWLKGYCIEENGCRYLGDDNNPYLVLIDAEKETESDITVNNNTKVIYDKAFYECKSPGISIPDSVKYIGNYAFSGCDSLESITIPDGVTRIGYCAFEGCRRLTSITIPNSVTSIENYTFEGCSSLKSITIPNSVTSIGDRAFSNCDSLTSITIPNSVTSIGDSAFARCGSLTSITIPNSVTSIGRWAFVSCRLTSITIPDSVTSIGDSAFYGCHMTIYCETEYKPDSWDSSWNISDLPVVWGYSGK